MVLEAQDLDRTLSILKETDKRAAAEVSYALGVLCKQAGDYELMRWYRAESIALFLEIGIETEEQAWPIYDRINGVPLPNLIHEGVVASRLRDPS